MHLRASQKTLELLWIFDAPPPPLPILTSGIGLLFLYWTLLILRLTVVPHSVFEATSLASLTWATVHNF